MKRLPVVLVCLLVFIWMIWPPGNAVSAARFSNYGNESIRRVINGELQDLSVLIRGETVVLFAGGMSAEEIDSLKGEFGLDGGEDLYERPEYKIFKFKNGLKPNDAAVMAWNRINEKARFASLVFGFPEGDFALSGNIKIRWKKFLSKEEILAAMTSLGLEVAAFDDAASTALVRVTKESGKNVLMWAIYFDPANDGRVASSQAEFIRVMAPLRVETEIRSEGMRGSAASIQVGQKFSYVVRFIRAPNAEISFDDLSVNTKLLRMWSPKDLPKTLRKFNGERKISAAAYGLPSGEIVDEVEYEIRVLRSGAFLWPGLRYYYSITGNVEENKKRLEGMTPEVSLFVAPAAHPKQITVNDIPNIEFPDDFRSGGAFYSSTGKMVLGFGVLLAGFVFAVFAISVGRKEKKTVPVVVSNKERAYEHWQAFSKDTSGASPVDRARFLKELIGVLTHGDKFAFAGLNSSDWKEKIGAIPVINPETLEKSYRFIRDAEGGTERGIDFSALVLEILE